MNRTFAFRCSMCRWETPYRASPGVHDYGGAHVALAEYVEHLSQKHPFATAYVARLRMKIGGDG